MLTRICFSILTAALLHAGAMAASVEVDVRDQNERAVEGAVVELLPGRAASPPVSPLPLESTIDQQHETFLPLVTLIRKGGRVIFTNHDTTMHQVYSFSEIKQFAFEIDQGQRSDPVVFDKPGLAAIGCNIHDHMIAYVYVADSPWTARTDSHGRVQFEAPTGDYSAKVWHPNLPPGNSPPGTAIVVLGNATRTGVKISLSYAPTKAHTHMQMY